MKKSLLVFLTFTALVSTLFLFVPEEKPLPNPTDSSEPLEESKKLDPNDHWQQVRSYPFAFDQAEYVQRMVEIQHLVADNAQSRAIELSLNWQEEGPGNIGGRFNALAMSPTDQNVIYAGAANGGIFKTTNGGTSWNPIFDDLAYLAIGEIEIDPTNENTLYVGTGDKNFGGGSHLGNGVYKSTDAGTTWSHLGLEQTGIITEITIDPTNANRIFVSTLGNTYEKTTERGVYRTTDGGVSWQNVLFISDSSGVIDMVMDPSDPNILYASGFNRINLPFQAKVTGPDANIYKTTDGGDTWTELTNGLPTGEHSRIGLAISNTSPNTLYASYTDGGSQDILDIYKTTDAGANWSALNVHSGGLPTDAQGGFGWYFGEVYMNPYDNDQLIVPGVDMFKSQDGGATWTQNVPDWWDYDVHADKHAILFLDANSYIIATDGGLYKTTNNGASWLDIENIPVTQFYHIAVDPVNAGNYGGGAQDNGCMQGNGLNFNFWERLWGGDGFRMKFLENDPGGHYFESQYGGLAYYNTLSGDYYDLQINPIGGSDRVNWDSPYYINEPLFDLYVGSAHMQYMGGAPFGTYQTISPDLTKVGMGTATGLDKYHTITEIEQPSINPDKLFVGTSDGLVWRGDLVGSIWDWTNITGSLPDRYVTAVRCSPEDDAIVYAAFSGYKYNEEVSYLYKSDDNGSTWQDISGNLPGITVNDICVIPNYNEQYLFAALDGGVYFTSDGGAQWDYVGVGLPFATITELEIDYDNKKLIVGTYSRSMWSYDISWIENLTGNSGGVGLAENHKEAVKFFPNPARDIVYFSGIDEEQIKLYNAQGQIVLDKKAIINNGFGQLSIANLPSGVYFYNASGQKATLIKN
ncbi:MAG: T9SS type A sorting domain-containing protein [Crocinitomicaceae bacterium]